VLPSPLPPPPLPARAGPLTPALALALQDTTRRPSSPGAASLRPTSRRASSAPKPWPRSPARAGARPRRRTAGSFRSARDGGCGVHTARDRFGRGAALAAREGERRPGSAFVTTFRSTRAWTFFLQRETFGGPRGSWIALVRTFAGEGASSQSLHSASAKFGAIACAPLQVLRRPEYQPLPSRVCTAYQCGSSTFKTTGVAKYSRARWLSSKATAARARPKAAFWKIGIPAARRARKVGRSPTGLKRSDPGLPSGTGTCPPSACSRSPWPHC